MGETQLSWISKPSFQIWHLTLSGLGVFNYDFGSVMKKSLVIKVHEINIHSRSYFMGLDLSFSASFISIS